MAALICKMIGICCEWGIASTIVLLQNPAILLLANVPSIKEIKKALYHG